MSEIKPSLRHLSDPYVLQLIETISKQDDRIEWHQSYEADLHRAIEAKDKRIAELDRENEMLKRAWPHDLLDDNERLRAALWEEYCDSFNYLGPTRQSRWKSAEAYADALMADFDKMPAFDNTRSKYKNALKELDDE